MLFVVLSGFSSEALSDVFIYLFIYCQVHAERQVKIPKRDSGTKGWRETVCNVHLYCVCTCWIYLGCCVECHPNSCHLFGLSLNLWG